MCPLPSFNSYKFLAVFVAESTLLPTFPLSIVFVCFFTHRLTKAGMQWSCPVGTFGSSYVDADPEQQEEIPKAHEEWGHQEDEELFVDVLSVLGVGDLINEEAGREEHAHGQQHHCQMAEDSRVHWAGWCTCSFLALSSVLPGAR